MEDRKIRVAITHGDTNGIGYETILKAFEDPMMLDLCTPIIYGNPKIAAAHRRALGIADTPFTVIGSAAEASDGRLNLLSTSADEVNVEIGVPTEASAEAARKAMQCAKEDLRQGLFDVLVQAPVMGSKVPDREDKSLLVLFEDDIRIGFVTSRLPIKEVAESITLDNVTAKGRIFARSLRRDFRVNNPRIAVLALNPQLGAEEETVIRPAVEALEQEGIQAFGPITAEAFLDSDMRYSFDGVLAMYDDQGHAAFRSMTTQCGVKMKAGFPFVSTSPNQTPSFDIAGKGVADATSLLHAIYAAVDIFRNRIDYDEPLANPLPKLYHEKREDGDKARFAMPRPKDMFKREDRKPKPATEQTVDKEPTVAAGQSADMAQGAE
jgi:4-hydroxythreonine-4-phosphate dehydrogenase